MTAFISWYLFITLLGLLTFPLAYFLFPALKDRGYTLARAAGLLIWGYLFWIMASLGVAQNDSGGVLLALALLAGVSVWLVANRKSEIGAFFSSNSALIITTEILFLISFAFLAFVRSANPELTGTERPMELAFINAILRSPTFPPQDPWLSGYAISYYYFGYVITAMLARVTGILGSEAHNLMTALVFALGAVGSFGILYNLLSKDEGHGTENGFSASRPSYAIGLALLAPLFLLLVSNFGALLEVLHQAGLFWKLNPATGEYTSAFWTWLDMKELSAAPMLPFHGPPLDRYLWWWRSSRVVQDYDMMHRPLEVIDEFPFFSFLLGDLHPHVLAIPFGLLAVSTGLNIFLGGWRGSFNVLGTRLRISAPGFVFTALLLGGLAFLNTWDILIAAALIVASYVLWRANEDGWRWDRFEDLLLFGIPLGILAIVLYLPFYVGFSSQAGGILPSFMYPTRGAHLWTMWGTLLIPILIYLVYLWRGERFPSNWKLGYSLGLGFVISLLLISWLLGWLGLILEKDFVNNFLVSQGMDAGQFFTATLLRRLSYIGGLITTLAVLIPALAFLFAPKDQVEPEAVDVSELQQQTTSRRLSTQFVLFILALGAILIITPDFVYLRDKFGYRINTVFKFYYQAWMLWSLVAAFAISKLLQNLRGLVNVTFRMVIGLVIFAGLLYPALGLLTKTNNFEPPFGFTLDDFDRVIRETPDEAAAIEWLRSAPDGVIAEAIGDSYQYPYARISTHTGMQTVLGWPGHEDQWRGSYIPQGTRRDDIDILYSSVNWEDAQAVINMYHIRYIYIGYLERSSMAVNEAKFQIHLKVAFQQGGTTIYEVPEQLK